ATCSTTKMAPGKSAGNCRTRICSASRAPADPPITKMSRSGMRYLQFGCLAFVERYPHKRVAAGCRFSLEALRFAAAYLLCVAILTVSVSTRPLRKRRIGKRAIGILERMAGLALASWQGARVRRQLEQQHDPMLQSALGEWSDMNVCHQWATIGFQPSVAQHDWPLAGRHFAIATRQQLHGGSPNGQLIQLDAFAGWSGKAQQLLGRRVVNVNPMV